MIRLVLIFIDRQTEDKWRKEVVMHRPLHGELIEDSGLLFRVVRIEHNLVNPLLGVTIEGQVKGNVHWELGHERGWELEQ